MAAPDISVIVPVHNQEKYVGRCMRSLLSQDIERDLYEVILIDDGSTDRSAYAIDMFADEMRIVSLPTNRGLPAALNAGLQQARGSLVVRVDADDYVNARFLSVLHLWLTENPGIDAVACDYLLVDNDEEVLGRGNCEAEPIACGIMFRLAHLQELGLYDEKFMVHEDLEFRYRFTRKYSITRLPVPLYRYRRHETNMTNDLSRQERYLSMLREKYGEELQEGPS
jgi:glycosyltransferase involved in cell wall biosynthesis